LPVVLYGLETWSLTLREEHRPRAVNYEFEIKLEEVVVAYLRHRTERLRENTTVKQEIPSARTTCLLAKIRNGTSQKRGEGGFLTTKS